VEDGWETSGSDSPLGQSRSLGMGMTEPDPRSMSSTMAARLTITQFHGARSPRPRYEAAGERLFDGHACTYDAIGLYDDRPTS